SSLPTLPELRVCRPQVHRAGREPAVHPSLPQRGEEGRRAVIERRHLHLSPPHLAQRLCIGARAYWHPTRRSPAHRRLGQPPRVDASIDPLHQLDQIRYGGKDPAAPPFPPREWVWEIDQPPLRPDPLAGLPCRCPLRNQLTQIEPYYVHPLRG